MLTKSEIVELLVKADEIVEETNLAPVAVAFHMAMESSDKIAIPAWKLATYKRISLLRTVFSALVEQGYKPEDLK